MSQTQPTGQWSLTSTTKTLEADHLCGLLVKMMSFNVELRGFYKFGLVALSLRCKSFSSRHYSFNLLEL